MVLDKIRRVHRFLQGLETVCDAVEDVSQTNFLKFLPQLTTLTETPLYQGRFNRHIFIVQSKTAVTIPSSRSNMFTRFSKARKNAAMQCGNWPAR